MAALFPNDAWLRWEAYTQDAADKSKKDAIEAYMANKLRLFNFQDTVSRLLYDYIDYGNVFADSEYVKKFGEGEDGDEVIAQGPRALRRSPYDVIFNLLASSFDESYQVIRHIKTIGEMHKELKENPDSGYLQEVLDDQVRLRQDLAAFSAPEIDKATGITIDGFGSFSEYLQSDYVELFEFRGSIHDKVNDEFLENYVITVIDRTKVFRKEPMPSWFAKSSMVHGGWRYRPDNLYAMGPLDNLIGMQYRIDHLENIKADLFDLIAQPPLKIRGMVEDFDWEPFAQIIVGEDGDVEVLKVDAVALQADTEIALLEAKMEEFAGAPKQAIGQRTPGEKTAFEVNVLEQNSSKMFIEKVVAFEINVVEPLLNNMLESARRHLDGTDVVGVMDTDLGVEEFLDISRDDLLARGKIRPIGARHFAIRAQQVQNYMGFRTLFGQDPGVMNHISGLSEAEMFEDLLGFEKFELVRPNIRLEEMAESQKLVNQLTKQVEEEAVTPVDEDEAAVQAEELGQEGEQF
jgi:hypothetical protein|tara:strand:+ start:2362 stop:3915 length:1554 start_codon:yes stop_codon:yes gene_type:complete